MSVSYEPASSNSPAIIRISGTFDFNMRQEFRDAYEKIGSDIRRCIVDFRETEYIDSSALGMLLLFRDYLGGNSSHIELVNCGATTSKIFKISNFHQLFTITDV